jgi:hypothetical protein
MSQDGLEWLRWNAPEWLLMELEERLGIIIPR